MGMVRVASLHKETLECSTDQLMRLALEGDRDSGANLWVSRVTSEYPLLTVYLKGGLGVVLRIDEDPMRPGGEMGTETFITIGDGSWPADQSFDFIGLGGGRETFSGEVIVSDSLALATLEAFADDLDWPAETRWSTAV